MDPFGKHYPTSCLRYDCLKMETSSISQCRYGLLSKSSANVDFVPFAPLSKVTSKIFIQLVSSGNSTTTDLTGTGLELLHVTIIVFPKKHLYACNQIS